MRCFRFLLGAATLLLSVSAQVDPPPGYNAALETNDGVAKAEQPDAVRPAAERRAMGGAVLRPRFCDPNRLPVYVPVGKDNGIPFAWERLPKDCQDD